MRVSPLLFLSAACVPIPRQAQATAGPASTAPQPATPGMNRLEQGEGRTVATKLADQLVGAFVFREQADAYAAMLRKNAAAGRTTAARARRWPSC
jgi:hypothetical protein